MLLQKGSTRVPAGTMSSVEMSSPTLSSTGSSSSSGMVSISGMESMLTVFSSRTCRASSSGSGGTSMAVLTLGCAGDATSG